MSAEIDRRIQELGKTIYDDRNIARRLAIGLLDRWGVSGLERSVAVGRIEGSLRNASDSRISSDLDFVEEMMRQRRTSKK